jgi:hypothetical protein
MGTEPKPPATPPVEEPEPVEDLAYGAEPSGWVVLIAVLSIAVVGALVLRC